MPKISKDSAPNVQDVGLAVDRGGHLRRLHRRLRHDPAGPLPGRRCSRGCPDDSCPCPHWGYLFAGKITVRYADREEVFEAGDAFYMAPGHVPAAEAGTEFVQFSPTDQLAEVQAVMTANARRAMQGA